VDGDNKVVALKDRNGAYVGKYDSNNVLLDDLVYISNSEYNELCNTTSVVEEVDINYETVYSYLSKLEYTNVHEIKPIYVKGISALNDK
jgi:predicted AAA+ superfamily ATPase